MSELSFFDGAEQATLPETPPGMPWHWCTGECWWNDAARWWSFDIETNNQLDPTSPTFRIVQLGICDGIECHVLREADVKHGVSALVGRVHTGGLIVGHNASAFDRYCLETVFGTGRLPAHDTLLMSYPLDERRQAKGERTLETLAHDYLGAPPWKVLFNWRTDMNAAEEAQFGLYNALDCWWTLHLAERFESGLRTDPALWRLYEQLLLPASRALCAMTAAGLYVSPERLADAEAAVAAELADALATLRAECPQTFNPASPQQVADLLYRERGLSPVRWTPGGAPSTGVEALKLLREQTHDPLLDALLRFRVADTLGKFTQAYRKRIDADGPWIHPSYTLVHTVTGRTSAREPNLQNLPRDPRLRSLIAAPPGKVLLQADYSMAELRCMAYISGEPNMKQAFIDGRDLHRMLAARITGKPEADVTKTERTNAKPVNFAYLYGADAATFVRLALEDYDQVVSLEEAEAARDAFFTLYPGLLDYYAYIWSEVCEHKAVRSPIGQVRRLPEIDGSVPQQVAALRQAINFPTQNLSNACGLVGLTLLTGMGLQPRGFIHDALLLYVDDDEAAVATATDRVREALEHEVPRVLAARFGIDLDVPLVAEITVAPTWR